jgi:hypothetical protein
VRIITGTVGTFIAGLVVFNRPYLAPFASPEGIVVAFCISLSFGFAIWWLQRIAQIRTPARFLTGRNAVATT